MREDEFSRRELYEERPYWLMALGGPLIWTAHFLISYFLVEAACKVDFLATSVMGVTALSAIVIILTVIACIATAYVFVQSRRSWKRTRQERWDNQRGSPGLRSYAFADTSQEFLTFAGILLSPLFFVLIIITGIPAFFLQPCIW